jgi:Secretion system C-terminal sorting domain
MKHSTMFLSGGVCSPYALVSNTATSFKACCLSLMLVLWGSLMSAQTSAPINDGCDGALPILCGQTLTGSTANATTDSISFCGNTPFGQVYGEPGVWFSHLGTGGSVTVALTESVGDNAFDTFVGIYTGTCAQLTCVGGDDDSGSEIWNSSYTFFAQQGVTYYIYATGWEPTTAGNSDGDSGPFIFELSCVPACQAQLVVQCPADVTVECGSNLTNLELTGAPTFDGSEICDLEINATYSDVTVGSTSCSSTIVRTWSITLGDLSATCTQVITVVDTQGPVFPELSDINVQCLESVEGPIAVTAVDACSGEVVAESWTSQTGELTERCALSTAFGPGADWAVWLPVLAANAQVTNANFVFDSNGGTFDQFFDGTAHLYGTVVNTANSNEQFVVDLWFENKADWATWSGLGRNYKNDLLLACATTNHINWEYFELVGGFSTLTGAGDLAGDVLSLYHMPSNYYFGFQKGIGANNKNCSSGLSGWFSYDGFVDGTPVAGHGDVNVDASCTPNEQTDCVHHTSFTHFYRAEDACGHATIASYDVIVDDTIAPVFANCPESLTIECDQAIPAVVLNVTATDNCAGDVIVTYLGEIAEGNNCYSTLTRTWSAIDVCGNRADCVQTITIVDTTAPVLSGTPAAEITVECDAVPLPAIVSAQDNCQDGIVVNFSEENIPGNCPGNYTLIRTWSATDSCENGVSFTQTIHVQDTTAPVFDDYEFYAHIECDEIPALISATDNCGEATVEVTYEILNSGGCLGVYYRIYTATDACGNTATAEQYIAIQDLTAPILYGIPAEATIECSDVTVGENGNYFGVDGVYGVDNCEMEVTISYSEEVVATNDGCDASFDIIRTWVGVDYCENDTMVSVVFHIVDTTAPYLTIPADYTAECSDELVYDAATAWDNCSEYTISEEVDTIAGNCPQNYQITRTFIAIDACGNSSAPQTQTITVQDTTDPIFNEYEMYYTFECNTPIVTVNPTATDNCGEVSYYTFDSEIYNQGPCYSYFIRTTVATDECGNNSEVNQLISIVDTTAPVITGAPEVEILCEEFSLETGIFVTATDNCNEFEIVIDSTQLASGECAGVYIRYYTAHDVCGNVSPTFIQVIRLLDEVAPVGNEPQDITVLCSDEIPSFDPEFTDNCGGEVVVVYSGYEITEICDVTYTESWTATDNCGNSTTIDRNITIYDNVNPWFEEFPADFTINCDEEVPAPVFPLAYDNCDPQVEIELAVDTMPGSCPQELFIYRIFRAYDNCGNQAVQTQIVTVVDETAPSLEGESEVIVECGSLVPYLAPTATDNCDAEVDITYADYSTISPWYFYSNGGNGFVNFSNLPNGFTIGGSDSNSSSNVYTVAAATACQVTISFDWDYVSADNYCGQNGANFDRFEYAIDGVTTGITANIIGGGYTQSGNSTITVPAGSLFDLRITAIDDQCGLGTVTISNLVVEEEEEICPIVDCIVRVFTATDDCGNSATFSQHILTQDTTAPVIAGPIEVTVPCEEFSFESGIFVEATDLCSEVEIVIDSTLLVSGECAGVYMRYYTAYDVCGNASEQFLQIIRLIDETAPIGIEPLDITVHCDEQVPSFDPMWYDNCGGELTYSFTSPEVNGYCNVSFTQTWTATDNCGNTSSVDRIVTLIDDEAPYFLYIPYDYTAECDEQLYLDMAYAYDNCDYDVEISVAVDTIPGTCPQNYQIVRTFTATDECGNTATSVQTITVQDTTAPVFGDYVGYYEFECDQEFITELPTATDNCGAVTYNTVDSELSYDGPCFAFFYRTTTATDECGNSSEAAVLVIVRDTTAPIITGQFEIEIPCEEFSFESGIYVTATDNCNEFTIEIVSTELFSGQCAGVYERVYVAYDVCGNYTNTFSQIIRLIDVTAPTGNEPADITIACTESVPAFDPEFVDNCGGEVEVVYAGFEITDVCGASYTETWTGTDNCGNVTVIDRVVTVVDNNLPVIYAPEDIIAECTDYIYLMDAYAWDSCDYSVDVTVLTDTVLGNCPANMVITRTFTATDDCGNQSSDVQTITIQDTTAPMFGDNNNYFSYQCLNEIEVNQPEAWDACSAIEYTYADDTLSINECSADIIRTWTATDACGNASTFDQYISVYDYTAPVIETELTDVYVECASEIPAPVVVVATDNCDANVTIDVLTQVLESDDCGNQLLLVSYTAYDNCQNSDYASYYIYVNDVTAPELTGCPQDLVLACTDTIPAAAVVTATDNCGGTIEVTPEEFIIGETPEPGSIADCDLLTPVRPAGNPCNYPYDWAMAMFNMPAAHRYYQLAEGELVRFPNGTAHVTATLINAANPANGFSLDVWFGAEKDWSAWSTQSFPTSFKADCSTLGANHVDWLYFIMQNNAGAELNGFGAYTGSAINLVHAPANNYFGFQLGDGANNYNNADNGFGGWFTYSGSFVNGDATTSISGAGDFAFELDCCPDYYILRQWTASDCSGNSSTCQQYIMFEGNIDSPITPGAPTAEVVETKELNIMVAPNPADNNTVFTFKSAASGRAQLEVFDMAGAKVADVYNNNMEAGMTYRVDFSVNNLATGIYMFRISQNGNTEMGRLVINK